MPLSLVYLSAALLLASVHPLLKAYVEFIYLIVWGTFAWGVYVNILKKQLLLPLAFLPFVVLFNPIDPPALSFYTALAVKIGGAALLLFTRKHIAV